MKAISLKEVSLKYRIEFKESGKVLREDFWALQGINIDVGKGEAIGIIGENGAGKTTLLKIIAGMLKPDKGAVWVNGTVSTLMEIGAGFQKDLTGRENIYLTSSFFGLTKEQIEARYDDIAKFASIGRFINAPVKTYSQGMYMRLAFAIAIYVDPDILLIDDIFAVGDLYAQHKCINKMFELKEMGKTIIFVTHDIETAKRFCQRGIFLKDGRVIREGSLKEIVSYYLKTVGDKKGIGILQGEHLGLVFNNGKLILNWDDDNITKEWGGHASILSGGNRYSSLQADWELKESNAEKLVLEGRFWDLPITQLWDIRVDGIENKIDLKIEMDVRKSFDFQECITCFMFREDYKYWFNPFNKELFKVDDLSREFSWKCVNSHSPAVNFIGLSAQGSPVSSLPSVILEDDVYVEGKLLEIKNTDHRFKARVLQSKVVYPDAKTTPIEAGKHLLFHNRIKVIKDSSREESFREDAPKTMMPKAIGGIDSLSLSVDDNNKISLYWRNKKLTSSKGLKTKFYYNGKIYHSSDAIWKIHKVSAAHLDILIRWIDSPLRQIWNIELLGDGILSWKVYMKASEDAVIRNSKFGVMFSPQYSRWVTSSEEGEISEELNTDSFKNIVMRNDPYGIVGLKGIKSKILELPYVLLHDTSDCVKFNSLEKKIDKDTSNLAGLDGTESIVTLYLLNPDSKESVDFPKGSYLVCDARILVDDDFGQKKYIEKVKEEKKQRTLSLRKSYLCDGELVIENGQYKFSFLKDRGKLFFKDREITKNFGIYTSLYSKEFDKSGLWYASLDAIWEILSFKRKRLVVRGRWPYFPITQIWEIKAGGKGFIWKVDMEVSASTLIEKQQAYLMLSDDYSNWGVSGGQSGFFAQEFALLRWDALYREKAVDRLYIEAKKDSASGFLPGLNFSCAQEVSNFEAIVENSNISFGSRILGFERIIDKDSQRIEPGVYKYFQGAIELS